MVVEEGMEPREVESYELVAKNVNRGDANLRWYVSSTQLGCATRV